MHLALPQKFKNSKKSYFFLFLNHCETPTLKHALWSSFEVSECILKYILIK